MNSYCLFTVNDNRAHMKSIKSDTIGIRQRFKEIARTLIENHAKWNAAHRRGMALCKSVEKCKTRAINSLIDTDLDLNAQITLYPPELKSICEKLQTVTAIFQDIQHSAHEARRQILSLLELSAATTMYADRLLVFRTWNSHAFTGAIAKICTAYGHECKMKGTAMQNLAHSRDCDELAMHLAVWEYQTYAAADVDILFKALAVETDIEFRFQ